ncbi:MULTISPECIES: hypothetical protein [unclassified Pseudomonas]|uniref:hypothetical protein n=1 Tax=unclassified Pseudomonas TaxID=196821 RepID=UPI00131A0506|nr:MULTISPECIES: hypothetical protein [unclassified Pseudomonas]MDX3742434.1 hypothetical protein [Pseudomonas sp.]WHH52863.1 hypothetical protein QFA96_12240 [Pseudomonas sp. Ap32]
MKTTTFESSAPYQRALDWSVPSQWQPQLRRDLDELQRLRATQPMPQSPAPDKTAMQARARHAGATKVERKHDALDAMIEKHRPQLVAWTGSDTSRACWLARQIAMAAGTDCALNMDGRPSGWRSVYEYLKTLSL